MPFSYLLLIQLLKCSSDIVFSVQTRFDPHNSALLKKKSREAGLVTTKMPRLLPASFFIMISSCYHIGASSIRLPKTRVKWLIHSLTESLFGHILSSSGMEQLVARKAHNLEVPGSSPGPATIKKAQSGFCHF